MVPAHFVALPAFPLTPNRKVDRKALPAPSAKAAESEVFVAPETDVEAEVAAIWARVLGVPKVGSKDNFFALGGHSLLAVQLHRELRDKLGVAKLSITDIFRFPTLSALAGYLSEGGKAPVVLRAKAPQPMRPAAAPQPAHEQPVRADTPAGARADARADAMARRRAMRAARLGADA
jgi:acyl carrier protein